MWWYDGECELADVDQKNIEYYRWKCKLKIDTMCVGVHCSLFSVIMVCCGMEMGRAAMQEIERMNKICELKRKSNAFRFVSIGSLLGKWQAPSENEVNGELLWAQAKTKKIMIAREIFGMVAHAIF